MNLFHKGFKTCIYPKWKAIHWARILQWDPGYIIWNYENREKFFLTTDNGRILSPDDVYSLVNDGCFADGFKCEGWMEHRWVYDEL
jgi:hypothetical protein